MDVAAGLAQRLQAAAAVAGAHLRAVAEELTRAAADRQAPDWGRLPPEARVAAATAACVAGLLALPAPRRAALAAADTALATLLLVLLAALLAALPLGTLYISYRGLLFLAASLAGSYPLIAKLLPAAA